MDAIAILVAASSGTISGLLASTFYVASKIWLLKQRLAEVEAEVEGLSAKVLRRTQRENAQVSAENKAAQAELEQFVSGNIRNSPEPQIQPTGMHPAFRNAPKRGKKS